MTPLKSQVLEATMKQWGFSAPYALDWIEEAVVTDHLPREMPFNEQRVLFAVALADPVDARDTRWHSTDVVCVMVGGKKQQSLQLSVPLRWLSHALQELSTFIHIGGMETWRIEVLTAGGTTGRPPRLIWRTFRKKAS